MKLRKFKIEKIRRIKSVTKRNDEMYTSDQAIIS